MFDNDDDDDDDDDDEYLPNLKWKMGLCKNIHKWKNIYNL